MRFRSAFAFVSITLFLLSPAKARESARHIKLAISFVPQLDQNGKPTLEAGEPDVSYISKGAHLDKNGNLDIRADVLIRSQPATPHRYFGRLVSLRDDVQIITSDRIVTDGKGVFRATLRSRSGGHGDWQIAIARVHRHRPTHRRLTTRSSERASAVGSSLYPTLDFAAARR